jgi:SAM-dependent methyltransferase
MPDQGPPSESGYSSVDQTRDPAAFVRRLDGMAATEFWQGIKQRTYALLDLRPGNHVLDVGCGTGDDVRALARLVGKAGKVVGVDSSLTMIAEARRRSVGRGLPATFRHADAEHLPFADARFDGCRAERVLQHLTNPRTALAEMARVTRRRGRIVLVEPDYGTLTIRGADPMITRRILACRAAHFRSGQIGRQLPGLCRTVGLAEVSVSFINLTNTDFERDGELALLRKYVDGAQAAGAISENEGSNWLAELSETDGGGYRHAITVFVASGSTT